MLLRSAFNHATRLKCMSQKSDLNLINLHRSLSIKIAVVGSGPAGFYTTQKLLKNPNVVVDIYEKLPVPFGLVRYGVAPDHQDVKNVINSFTTVANNDRVNFYGNVDLGQVINLDHLMEAYHAVVLCYGSAQDKLMNIPGEQTTKNTISARNFVGWYNGVPEDKDLDVTLDCDTACIIGHGNVALDCTRILLKPANLEKTDITSYAHKIISNSRIKRIFIIGRRGPFQASFSSKELREIIKLNENGTVLDSPNIFRDSGVTLNHLIGVPRQRRRLTELLLNLSANKEVSEAIKESGIECRFKFLSNPHSIESDPSNGRVSRLVLQKNKFGTLDKFMDEKAKPEQLDEFESIDCGLIIRSIGYKAVMVDKSLPVDAKLGAILNSNGRVSGRRGLYCSGWLATGATGVIAGTLSSSQTTAKSILEDISTCDLPSVNSRKPGHDLISKYLKRKSVQVVHFNDWMRIDEVEQRLGEILGKNREKLVEVNKMLQVARGENIDKT